MKVSFAGLHNTSSYFSANKKPSQCWYYVSGMSLLMQVAGELKMIAKDFNIAVLVYTVPFLLHILIISFPVAQWVEHGVINAKIVGSNTGDCTHLENKCLG